jgi:pimeloyl-ACP methyl ester carboxylesterase
MAELVLPWVPEGRLVHVDRRGELFVRIHRHPDPDAPVVVLLHGWTSSIDLQFVMAYEALAARYTFVGIDHRGHGRGLRHPDPFTLEDAADDAAALVRELDLGPVVVVGYSMGGPISMLLARRHPELVAGIVVQATALDWKNTRRDRFLWRVLPVAGSWLRTKAYRRYLNRAVPKVLGIGRRGESVPHPVHRYLPWLLSEMSRNDAFVMVEAGRALADYDARSWAATLGVPAGSLVTTADHLVSPRQQWALAAALGATTRELRADHFATLSHPEAYTALTVELIEDVRQRASAASSASGAA